VLQCVAMCCNMLQCVAVCFGLDCERNEEQDAGCFTWSNAVMCCSVLQCVTMCCSVFCVYTNSAPRLLFNTPIMLHAASCCMVALVGVRASRIERPFAF